MKELTAILIFASNKKGKFFTLLSLSASSAWAGESYSLFLSLSLPERLLFAGEGGGRGSDRGMNLMPLLTSTSILSVNPKRGEAEESEWKGY